MFGYVAIDKPNILIKDYQTYRSHYCGLCKAIGKRTGQLPRLTLNYDIVLLSLLGHNYENLDPEFETGHCVTHPIGKKIEYIRPNDVTERVADINTILGYYKLYDDVVDERKHRALRAAFRNYYKKAKKRLPDFDRAVGRGYEKLREQEKKKESVEKLCDTFGYMLSAAGDALTKKCDPLLREFLFYVGRWVYCIDAYDDLKKDFERSEKGKKSVYNPFLRENIGSLDTLYAEGEKISRVILYDSIARAIECYNKMHIEISEGPLSNIVYRGLKQRTEFVLTKRGEKWQKEIRL